MMFIIWLVMCTFAVQVHTDTGLEDDEEMNIIVDDREFDIMRRSNLAEWQFEGLPIDAPESGRRADFGPTESASSKKPPDNRGHRVLPPEIQYREFETEFAAIEQFPFVAALLMNDQMWCTGIVIGINKILTDAYCLQLQYMNRFNRELVKVLNIRVGSANATAGGQMYKAGEIFFHPNYKPNTLEFNFAVVKTSRNITFSKSSDVAIAKYSYKRYITTDIDITFIGWGVVNGIEDGAKLVVLKKIDLPVYNLADCQDQFGRDIVTEGNFCAGYISKPKNICHHDMGGAAIAEGLVVGLLSFGAKYCDYPDKPAVFSTIGRVARWFESLD